MQSKRGQLTVFVIIGVVIVAVVAILLYLKSVAVEKEEVVPVDIAPIKLYVEKCLEETAKDAVLIIALQGGYYILPEKSLNFLNIYSPYYLYEGEVFLPTIEMIENELSFYCMFNLRDCIDLETFSERGYEITIEIPEVTVTIAPKEIFFDVDMPVTIKTEDEEQTISRFSTDVETELMKLYNAASEYIDYQSKEPSFFAVSDAVEISSKNDIIFKGWIIENEDFVFSFIDNNSMIKNRPLTFNLAIKFI